MHFGANEERHCYYSHCAKLKKEAMITDQIETETESQTNLAELEGVEERVPPHEQDLPREAGFEQLLVADAVVSGHERSRVGFGLVERGGEIRG